VETYGSCCALHGCIPNFTNKQLALLRVGLNPVPIATRSPAVLIEDFRDSPHLLQADSQVGPPTRPQLLPFTNFLVYVFAVRLTVGRYIDQAADTFVK
jgi:hypothetical protein